MQAVITSERSECLILSQAKEQLVLCVETNSLAALGTTA